MSLYFLFRIFYTALIISLLPQLLDGIRVEGFGSALLAAVLLGALNGFLKPILVLVTLPLTIASFGLFLCVVNGLLLYMVGHLLEGVRVDSFGAAFLGAIVLTAAGWLFDWQRGKRFVFRFAKQGAKRDSLPQFRYSRGNKHSDVAAFEGKTIDLEQKGDRWE